MVANAHGKENGVTLDNRAILVADLRDLESKRRDLDRRRKVLSIRLDPLNIKDNTEDEIVELRNEQDNVLSSLKQIQLGINSIKKRLTATNDTILVRANAARADGLTDSTNNVIHMLGRTLR